MNILEQSLINNNYENISDLIELNGEISICNDECDDGDLGDADVGRSDDDSDSDESDGDDDTRLSQAFDKPKSTKNQKFDLNKSIIFFF